MSDEDLATHNKDSHVVFEGNHLSAVGNGKKEGDAVFTLDPMAKPKAIDLTELMGDFAGKKSLGIYELNGDTLRACWTLFSSDRPRPTQFESTPGSKLLLVTYKRVKR